VICFGDGRALDSSKVRRAPSRHGRAGDATVSGAEADALGDGGIAIVERATGTIRAGRDEARHSCRGSLGTVRAGGAAERARQTRPGTLPQTCCGTPPGKRAVGCLFPAFVALQLRTSLQPGSESNAKSCAGVHAKLRVVSPTARHLLECDVPVIQGVESFRERAMPAYTQLFVGAVSARQFRAGRPCRSDRGTLGGLTQFATQFEFAGSSTSL
jgi:hypothetical protein